MASRGRPNLFFKGRPWEVDSGRPQDVFRTSRRGPSECSNLDVPKFVLTFLSELIQSKVFQRSRCIENPVERLRGSIFSEIS